MKIVHFHNPGSPNVEQYKDMFAEHGIAYEQYPEFLSAEEQLAACRGADAIVTSILKFPREIIEQLDESVKCIVRVAMGYEIVDVEAATRRGIYVCNVPDYAMEEVAVHQTALILAALRKVCWYDWKDLPLLFQENRPPL